MINFSFFSVFSTNPLSGYINNRNHIPLDGGKIITQNNFIFQQVIMPLFFEKREDIWDQALEYLILSLQSKYNRNPDPILHRIFWGFILFYNVTKSKDLKVVVVTTFSSDLV